MDVSLRRLLMLNIVLLTGCCHLRASEGASLLRKTLVSGPNTPSTDTTMGVKCCRILWQIQEYLRFLSFYIFVKAVATGVT